MYLLIVLLEVWFIFRKDIIELAIQSTGIKRLFYAVLALGTYNTSEQALKYDHKIVKILAALGIPAACIKAVLLKIGCSKIQSNA